MKKHFLLLMVVMVTTFFSLNAQINTKNPTISSIIEINAENTKSPIPRITESERFELKNPPLGTLVFQTDNVSGLYYLQETGWIPIQASNTELNRVLVCNKIVTVDTVVELDNTIFTTCGFDVTTAIVLGYHEKNDGGGGIFEYDAALSGMNDGGLIFNGWTRTLVDGAINVKWYGAKSGGSLTDTALINTNTAAFQAAITELSSRFIFRPDIIDPTEALAGILIPSGEYIIGAQSLFPESFNKTLKGINYYSDGNAVLTFVQNKKGSYGFKNVNRGMFFTFRNLTFVGTDVASDLFYSESSGIAQDYYFDRCTFAGKFGKIFTLAGTNTNSEWGFNKCTFRCETETILHVGASNQFVNYWFDQTKFWLKGNSKVLVAEKGGHFKFVNCDWSGINPNADTYLFELNNPIPSFGVNDFRIINGRFELQNEHAKVLKSAWNSGNIEISADFGSQLFRNITNDGFDPLDTKHFEFNIGTDSRVNIDFNNSIMMGYHEYTFSANSFEGTARAQYSNCSFPKRNELDGFIRIPTTHINKSGVSFIEIEDAIFNDLSDASGNNVELQIPSVHYLPLYSNRGLKKKYFKIGHPARGGNPIFSEKFKLNFPEEAESVITKITWFLPAGLMSQNNNHGFSLVDNSGNILSSVVGNLVGGYNKVDDVVIYVKDLPGGAITLKNLTNTTAIQSSAKFMCLIEYY